MTVQYDLIVLGAGPVGENVADAATAAGLTCVVVESELVGGDCSFWACVPSKALLRPPSARDAARRVDGAKQAVSGPLDVAAVLARRDSFVSDWDDSGSLPWLESVGIDLVRGHGRITGERRVEVTTADGETVVLEANHAVAVCTGSAARVPNIPGLADAQAWTSRDATSVQNVPASLAILGGGVVAAEMATAFVALGSAVTVIARSGLLAGLEDFAGEAVGKRLRSDGATILGDSPVSVNRTGSGKVSIELDSGDTVTAAELLVATGRTPRTTDIGLESIGLTPGDWLSVDDSLRVDGVDWLYAVGDVNSRVLLTHQGKYQGRAAGRAIAARVSAPKTQAEPWGDLAASADHERVPFVIFSEPQVASVGLTAEAAAGAGYRTRVVDYDLGAVSGAGLHADGYEGFARMVVDEDRGVVIGVTFVGADVAELLHAATIAVVGEVPLTRLWHAVPAFPTMSEIWLRLLETYRAGE
ncbi:dihydrolipoyl dehydrogenase family protein [Mycetocola zhadangensis]|uniref:NAD(P)/FAD-dependent oxidoreductase n=1 Tax=Mycetocola zhadangensis TaxID=1164595 RepID=A0A3L7ITA8_9MICO|nr:NAD(P)/FAD-dependent oxidoreductase [Mycetocola zhadangensis]RLQ81447.1 NAD(P)/FAD-dependent oxidoreductase [Mycetocola zhadangensis]GGF01562.1 oxidoreductase [Mycetocola zhadangensis]